ncbi:MAG TPA: hypothetical protein RMH99_15575 [Sandaracinaceae bacterium LLY-WYZ-13_1]|nr:hypothetical protein [Sandaracinaceae bacterium LLY-WYZ-13_1]
MLVFAHDASSDGSGTGRIRWLAPALAIVALAAGCDGEPMPDDGGRPPAVHPRFELGPDPMDFGAVPWPDDLYLGEDGRIAVGALPSEDRAEPPDYPDALRRGLAELDGFSAHAPIFFDFPSNALDPASLPASPAATLREDASVYLLDADPASPTALSRVPVRVHWNAELGQLALRPYDGHPLTPGRRYAAVVTTDVRDASGEPIGPAAGFAAIRDAETRPSDPLEAEAYDRYGAVLANLARPRASVAALAVFTVQTAARDLRDARDLVWAGEVPAVRLDAVFEAGDPLDALLGVPEADAPGLDVEGGVQHRRIGWLVQGSFESPWLVSDEVGVHGAFRRDVEGHLEAPAADRVPFTLTLPSGDLSRVPVVIFQHGLGSERSDALAVADALAGSGFAVLAIDLPFHGLRSSAETPDERHDYGPGSGPDGFGEVEGDRAYLDFLGVAEAEGAWPALHPVYPRDMLRQSAVDLMRVVRVVREGDWGAVRAASGLESLGFAPDPLGFVGVSVGGSVGALFVTNEPEVGAASFVASGGGLLRLVERSATFAGFFLPLLMPKVGLVPEALEPEVYPASFHPELAIVQTILDRGDAMTFAPRLAAQPRHVLMQMAEHDETMPNSATEALARAAGVPIVDAEPAHTDLVRVEAPVSDNVELDARRVTRGLWRFAPATHGLLLRRSGVQAFEHPPAPPFTPIDPVVVSNPVAAAVEQQVFFFESWRAGAAEIARPTP